MRTRPLLIVLLGLASVGCSDIGCTAPVGFRQSQLEPQLKTPAGLAEPKRSDEFVVPPGEVAAEQPASACFVRPPQVVAPPPKD